MHTMRLPDRHDTLAPDGSQIRVLPSLGAVSLAHCTLPPGRASLAVRHRTVEEMWYVLSGRGEVWRSLDGREQIVAVETGVALTIPLGTHFQFRTAGNEPLTFLIATSPPWPGPDEAVRVHDRWPVGSAGAEDA